MKTTLTLLFAIAGIGAASAESLDVRQLIEQRWMTTVPVATETWSCAQADAATIKAAFEGAGAIDLSEVLNDDPRPVIARGPIDADMPVMAAGQ
ncbi:hypothetical protein GJ689_10140 [Rhodoplanes serenus]|jgi:hypothetical protein|uniref:Uncharacterized protein n=1 Tax=Rhodoplanes serenus TaxID=200615 RepID=A0A327KB87_9BRAD|nr:hypothetical protein [Rhodoplanes serenus]MBI5111674.1 hypothetical protein [Rhodovulum sp.]MTW16567.1 hypothetical protein [Rhodoplanes serenus]RAI35344.1 hypothetical protein CH340_06215 [Rhodoplanes serenus]VCU08593.1 hypothetical protein RHODGE_RHODGE_01759 [Rhodoplanes serenus]